MYNKVKIKSMKVIKEKTIIAICVCLHSKTQSTKSFLNKVYSGKRTEMKQLHFACQYTINSNVFCMQKCANKNTKILDKVCWDQFLRMISTRLRY